MSIHAGRVRGHSAPAQLASPSGTPLSVLGWKAAYWADDPSWTNPGNGNVVASWRDGGTSGAYTLTQSTGANKPTFRTGVTNLNGKSAIEFDGTASYLNNTSPVITQPFTVVAVLDLTSLTGDRTMSDAIGAGRAAVYKQTTNNKWTLYTGGAGFLAAASATTTGLHGIRAFANAADLGTSALATDAVTATTSSALSSTGFTGIRVGASSTAAAFGAMRLGFWGLYLGDITTDPNWQNLRRLLFNLYGATVT